MDNDKQLQEIMLINYLCSSASWSSAVCSDSVRMAEEESLSPGKSADAVASSELSIGQGLYS